MKICIYYRVHNYVKKISGPKYTVDDIEKVVKDKLVENIPINKYQKYMKFLLLWYLTE